MAYDNGIRLQLLNLLKNDPELTQREMNQKLGVSLGKINYCISMLVETGLIRVEKFKKQNKKTAYIYHLTSKGLEELSRLTLDYLKVKIKEYDHIRMEIKMLSEHMVEIDPLQFDNSELIEEIKKII